MKSAVAFSNAPCPGGRRPSGDQPWLAVKTEVELNDCVVGSQNEMLLPSGSEGKSALSVLLPESSGFAIRFVPIV